jgi:uncharacterized MAPEG superfamily protein
MLSDVQVLVWSAILTFVMACAGSYFRNHGWTMHGMWRAMGNRDDLPPPSAISGRADRAAMNMIENMAIFTALVAAVHFAGKTGTQADLGATLFFWGRVAFFPTYLAGIVYLRTVFWLVSIAGLAVMVGAVWS